MHLSSALTRGAGLFLLQAFSFHLFCCLAWSLVKPNSKSWAKPCSAIWPPPSGQLRAKRKGASRDRAAWHPDPARDSVNRSVPNAALRTGGLRPSALPCKGKGSAQTPQTLSLASLSLAFSLRAAVDSAMKLHKPRRSSPAGRRQAPEKHGCMYIII